MEQELKQLLQESYDLGPIHSLVPIKQGVSNANYKVLTTRGLYVARVCRYEPDNQIRVMPPFLLYAEGHSFPAPRLIRTRDGAPHAILQDAPVIVTTFVDGVTMQPSALQQTHITQLALAIAHLHALEWVPTKNSTTLHPSFILNVYKEWRDQTLESYASPPPDFEAALRDDYTLFSSDEFMQSYAALPQHLVHGDLIPGNVLFAPDHTVAAFVDLEEVGRASRLLDIARVMTTWFFQGNDFMQPQLEHFMNVYTRTLPFTEHEQNIFEQTVRYVTFRHAVFIRKMVLQGRLASFLNNEDVAIYLKVRREGIQHLLSVSE